MEIAILTLFPDYFKGPFDESMIKRARNKGILDIEIYNIRDFSEEKRKRVDDRSFGGGPGMVLMAPPLVAALRKVRREGSHVIYLSPQGEKLTAGKCRQLAEHKHLVLVCGHYEGIDERVMDWIDEEVSIGDFVLSSGAPAALVCVDAIARFLPGFLGKKEAVERDSFEQGVFDYPHYTRPVEFEGKEVPAVLLEGDHQKIAKFREIEALKKTADARPDLYFLHMSHEGVGTLTLENERGLGITLVVKELAQSVAFYRKVLQFPLLEEREGSATFAVGKSCLTLKEGRVPFEMEKNRLIQNEGEEGMREGKRVIFTIEIGDVPLFHQTLSRLKRVGRVVGQIEKRYMGGDAPDALNGKSLSRVAFTDVDDHPWVLCLTDMNLMVSK